MRILNLAISLTILTGCQSQMSVITPLAPEPRSNPGVGAQHFVNGKWLLPNTPGIKFEAGTRYAVNGVFVAEPPPNAEIIDLGGAWVVPPYGEAHNHSVDSKATQPAAQRYLDEGVYYFKNPNSIRSVTQPHRAHWQQPDTLDVSFSFGGLSKDEGHPEVLYRRLSGFGLYPSVAADELDGEAFYDVETLDKLNEKWPKIMTSRPVTGCRPTYSGKW